MAHSLGLSARNHKMSVNVRGPCEKSGENEEEEKEAVATAGHLARVPETEESSDSDLETEGAPKQQGTGLSLHLGDFFRRGGRGRLELRGQGTPVQQSKERSPLWDTFRAARGNSSPVPSLKCS